MLAHLGQMRVPTFAAQARRWTFVKAIRLALTMVARSEPEFHGISEGEVHMRLQDAEPGNLRDEAFQTNGSAKGRQILADSPSAWIVRAKSR